MAMSTAERVRRVQKEEKAHDGDPWRMKLETAHGKVGEDGIERLTTQNAFDILKIPVRQRGARASRKLSSLMSELGWTAQRIRGKQAGLYAERLRGYVRPVVQKSYFAAQ